MAIAVKVSQCFNPFSFDPGFAGIKIIPGISFDPGFAGIGDSDIKSPSQTQMTSYMFIVRCLIKPFAQFRSCTHPNSVGMSYGSHLPDFRPKVMKEYEI